MADRTITLSNEAYRLLCAIVADAAENAAEDTAALIDGTLPDSDDETRYAAWAELGDLASAAWADV